MMNFLPLWREISLGSDALWKLKQRSVTQLRVVFLLVISNLGLTFASNVFTVSRHAISGQSKTR